MARVLIVEDSVDAAQILRDTLSREHEVEVTRRGEDGIVLARRFRPHAVILDVRLAELLAARGEAA